MHFFSYVSSRMLLALMAGSTITAVVIWFAVFVPESEKLHKDFRIYLEQDGTDQIAETVGGNLSKPFDLKESLIQRAVSTDGNYVTVSSIVSGSNQDAGKEVFHSEHLYQVNAYSLAYKDMPQKQFAFKPGVHKQNYDFFHPMIFADAPLVYQATDTINGLEVYVFKSQTHNVDISDTVPKSSNVRILSSTNATFWVEPITGDLVKFEKSWQDLQVRGNKTIAINEKGWKKTTDYSTFILSEAAKSKIADYYYNTRVMPVLLASLTVGINLIIILQRKLVQSKEIMLKNAKLTAIGNLSARMSHDLRNTLTVIKSEVSLMSLQDEKGEKLKERLQRLVRAIDKMDHQIGGVMDFVRDRPLRMEQFASSVLIDRTLEHILVPAGIQIIAPVQDMTVTGDLAQLEVVLSNIIINAIQAVGDSGEIKISVEDAHDAVLIKIADSGPGIPPKHMSKIFEPLFTTKPRGTGLGLASCSTIVKNHGGKIWATNNPTTFTIWLPKKS